MGPTHPAAPSSPTPPPSPVAASVPKDLPRARAGGGTSNTAVVSGTGTKGGTAIGTAVGTAVGDDSAIVDANAAAADATNGQRGHGRHGAAASAAARAIGVIGATGAGVSGTTGATRATATEARPRPLRPFQAGDGGAAAGGGDAAAEDPSPTASEIPHHRPRDAREYSGAPPVRERLDIRQETEAGLLTAVNVQARCFES